MKWWVLQDPGEQPYGVIALDEQLVTRRYVPGVGLVPDPVDDDHVWKGELGAHPVSEDAALALITSGSLPEVGHLDASGGDVLPVPGVG